MPRYDEPPVPGVRYPDRPGAYAVVLTPQGEALLTDDGEGLCLPGGGIDPGEGPLQALHRGAMEETGWLLTPVSRLGAFQRFCYLSDYGRYARKVQHIYLCRPVLRRGEPTEPGHSPIWVQARDAADLISIEGEAAMMRAAVRMMGWR